jgi:flagellar basal body-associated protein FliL
MSEEAKTEAPKKKGKLPVIIVLALVLGAGGFFGMKARGGGKVEKPPIKLGKVEKFEEFLVNLRDPNSYVRTTLSLQFVDTFDVKKLEESTPAIRDAIITTLSTRGAREVATLEGKRALKRDLALAINTVLQADEKEAHKEADKKEDEGEKKADKKEKVVVHEDWDSQTGPVLKVLFTNFATQ